MYQSLSVIQDHTAALNVVLERLSASMGGGLRDSMAAVGHRVVHGGTLSKSLLVNPAVLAAIDKAAIFAPLHNPANAQGIRAAQALFGADTPQVSACLLRALPALVSPWNQSGFHIPCCSADDGVCGQVAVFDTAFHQTMPARAYTYALPQELCQEHHLRRYGAHGTSYRFLVRKAAQVRSNGAATRVSLARASRVQTDHRPLMARGLDALNCLAPSAVQHREYQKHDGAICRCWDEQIRTCIWWHCTWGQARAWHASGAASQ